MTKQFDPMAGTHISSACVGAVGLANTSGESVEFTFNGVDMVVRPGEDAAAVESRWSKRFADDAAAYRASPQGIAQAKQDAERAEKAKGETESLLEGLPLIIDDGRSLMRWLYRFTDVADHVAAKFDMAALADRLEAAGYFENQHVGLPKEDFQTERVMREYVVGQVISCLRNGMPPHPVTRSFVEQWGKLTEVLTP